MGWGEHFSSHSLSSKVDTKPQSKLKSKERLKNLDGAIIFNTKYEIPQNIAFVDDIP